MPTPDRVAFTVFGFDVMWYGICVALGIALAVFIVCRRAPKHGITSDSALNYALVVVVCGIIGARLYYAIFNWSYYGEDMTRLFMVREGGLAIHGGLLAGALALLICARFWKGNPLNMLDLFFVAVPLGQAIGRWGNYFNQEAHGGATDLPWAITVGGEQVHPTFLYESIWCLLLFVFLIFADNKRKFSGQTFLLYCMLYSVERFFVEALRTDSLMLGSLKQAQVLSAVVFILAIAGYVILNRRYKVSGAQPAYLTVKPPEIEADEKTKADGKTEADGSAVITGASAVTVAAEPETATEPEPATEPSGATEPELEKATEPASATEPETATESDEPEPWDAPVTMSEKPAKEGETE